MLRNLLISCAIGSSACCFAASPYLSRVYEYAPAPGQFVNIMPEYEEGDSYDKILEKAGELLCGDKTPGLVTLGSFGGYIIVGFDHPVVNVHGRYDFRIYGNSIYSGVEGVDGSAEPGIVMVSVDTNGNGIPDDEWYQLAGSQYHDAATTHNFNITYFRPDISREPEIDPDGKKEYDPDPDYPAINDRKYIRYTAGADNAEGYVMRNTFHSQPYWPQWSQDETISFSGTRLANNATPSGGTYILTPYKWGYVDNMPNDNFAGLSLDWAVNAQGEPVVIRQADFIMIYSAMLQYNGWIGETSTEVAGGEDLHPDAVYSAEWPDDPINPDFPNAVTAPETTDFAWLGINGDILSVRTTGTPTLTIHTPAGAETLSLRLDTGDNNIDISTLIPGIYIATSGNNSLKFVKK